jgi:hypothetical protein
MTILILDLETNGLVRRDLDLDDPGQPFAVRIAAEHVLRNGRRMNAIDLTVKPDGRPMKAGAEAVHGISGRMAQQWGLRENTALIFLAELARVVEVVVTFSTFDPIIIESLMLRLEKSLGKPTGTFRNRWIRPGLVFLNVQHPSAQQVCKIPATWDPADMKWPTLDEASMAILGEPPREGEHDAWDDLGRLRRIFFKLAADGHYPLEMPPEELAATGKEA